MRQGKKRKVVKVLTVSALTLLAGGAVATPIIIYDLNKVYHVNVQIDAPNQNQMEFKVDVTKKTTIAEIEAQFKDSLTNYTLVGIYKGLGENAEKYKPTDRISADSIIYLRFEAWPTVILNDNEAGSVHNIIPIEREDFEEGQLQKGKFKFYVDITSLKEYNLDYIDVKVNGEVVAGGVVKQMGDDVYGEYEIEIDGDAEITVERKTIAWSDINMPGSQFGDWECQDSLIPSPPINYGPSLLEPDVMFIRTFLAVLISKSLRRGDSRALLTASSILFFPVPVPQPMSA